jgi:hypothetical protein
MLRKLILPVGAIVAVLCTPALLQAQAHFTPGVANIRDYSQPEPGLYAVVYNYGYETTTLTDNNGNQINHIVLGPPAGPNITLNLNIDVKVYALAPVLIWVTSAKFFGAHYGAYIAPTFSNANITAGLSTVDGQGINPQTSQFGVGDLYVQPLWLVWNRKHFDTAASYGFYAPVGKYNYQTINLGSIGSVTIPSSTNIGLGYWTHQLQGNLTWYPNPNRGLAVTNTLTTEFNTQQRGQNTTNGDFLTWNWGGSMYLPLEKPVPHHLIEAGLAGYSQWQITDSTNVTNPSYHDQVHAIGAQVGLISIPWNMQLNFRYMHEFYSANRFQGDSYSLNLAYTIRKSKPQHTATPAP